MSRLLQIIGLFCKRPYKRDYILQKRPIILRSLLIVGTPYKVMIKTSDVQFRTILWLRAVHWFRMGNRSVKVWVALVSRIE